MRDLVLSQLPLLISIFAVLFLVPLELTWPRLRGQKDWWTRVPVIVLIGLTSFAVALVLTTLVQTPLVSFLKSFQIISFAKLSLPAPLIFIVCFLLADFLTYAFHWLSHKLNFLWRLHAIHHSDEHVTALTGYLHHPFEVVFSYVFMMIFYVLLGVPVIVVAAYIAVNSAHNIFSHADVSVPFRIDRILRLFIVTPDMHRTHHSIDMTEGNSNFGQIFSFWDRIFGTYARHPRGGEESLVMGLPSDATPRSFNLYELLVYPIRRARNTFR